MDRYREVRPADLSCQGLGGLHLGGSNQLLEALPLFRALATPRSKDEVRGQGIIHTRTRELVKDAFKDVTDVSKISVHIALGLEEPPLQLRPVSLIDFSSAMAVGRAKTPRMTTLRTIFYSRLSVMKSLGTLILLLLFFIVS